MELVHSIKYLGIVLDEQLKLSDHVRYLKRTLNGRMKMPARLRPLVGQDKCLNLYKSLVLPALDYADVTYDCLSAKDCYELQKLQNYSLRVILQVGRETNNQGYVLRAKASTVK